MTLLTAHHALVRELEYASFFASIANAHQMSAFRAIRKETRDFYEAQAQVAAASSRACYANAIGFASI